MASQLRACSLPHVGDARASLKDASRLTRCSAKQYRVLVVALPGPFCENGQPLCQRMLRTVNIPRRHGFNRAPLNLQSMAALPSARTQLLGETEVRRRPCLPAAVFRSCRDGSYRCDTCRSATPSHQHAASATLSLHRLVEEATTSVTHTGTCALPAQQRQQPILPLALAAWIDHRVAAHGHPPPHLGQRTRPGTQVDPAPHCIWNFSGCG